MAMIELAWMINLRPIFKFINILALGLSLSSCQGFDLTALLPGDSDPLLFNDDFTNPESGWDRVHTAETVSDYESGVFRMTVGVSGIHSWAFPHLNTSDVRIDVDAGKYGGPDDNLFGIICRATDRRNFYTFLVSSDGYYAIGKMIDGALTLLGPATMQYTEAINRGIAMNHLRVDCTGNSLALQVNNQSLLMVQDSSYQKGDVGLFTGTHLEPGVDIIYDNFTVMKTEAP